MYLDGRKSGFAHLIITPLIIALSLLNILFCEVRMPCYLDVEPLTTHYDCDYPTTDGLPLSNIHQNPIHKPKTLANMSECSISDTFVYAETYDANEQNEDRYVWRTNVTIPIQNQHLNGSENGGVTALAHIFAVMDGHGGYDCAEFVKNEVIDLTIEKLSEVVYDEDGIHLVYEGEKGCSSESGSYSDSGSSRNDEIVDSIKAVLVDVYQILDDRWFERISKLTFGKKPQTVCQKNGPWSVGCSSLLSVVLQLSGNCEDEKDSWWLFTAHCGDVRACLVDLCTKCNGDLADEVFVELTKDHTVKDKEEVSRICKRTSDPNPIRKNSAGSYCVAGSLAPTRAIGGKHYL